MTQEYIWGRWPDAFCKFGYDDGDGVVQTKRIARILEDAGYAVKYARWSPHNTMIYSIKKSGIEFMPLLSKDFRIGYDDPRDYLDPEIQDILDRHFPSV